MTDGVAIGVAQTCAIRGDVAANTAQHVQLARAAASEGARLLVFPELSLTGYELELGPALAFDPHDGHDARMQPLRAAAAETALHLIVGAPVRLDGHLHIGALIIAPDGVVDVYTKHHLGAFGTAAVQDAVIPPTTDHQAMSGPAAAHAGVVPPAEATFFEPGERNPAIEVGGMRAALAICADVGRPDHAARAAVSGSAAYLASMFAIPSEYDGDATKLQSYARTHRMLVALANHGCATGGLAAAGRSAIWSPAGELLAALDASGIGIVVATPGANGWGGRAVMLDGRVAAAPGVAG